MRPHRAKMGDAMPMLMHLHCDCNMAFIHDDRFSNRYANTVSIPVCKPIVMCKRSNSLFANRSSPRSPESNRFDSCDLTENTRDV